MERGARGVIGVWFPDFPECVAAGASHEELRERFAAAAFRKPWGHGLARHVIPRQRIMSQIGG